MMTSVHGWSVHSRNKSSKQKSELGNYLGIQNIYAIGANAPACLIMHLETVKMCTKRLFFLY
jgi:hypothetical protein